MRNLILSLLSILTLTAPASAFGCKKAGDTAVRADLQFAVPPKHPTALEAADVSFG